MRMSEQIAVSIIICTYNRADNLAQTLSSLGDVELPSAGATELIIVDNGSTDDTHDVARFFCRSGLHVRYIHEARRGKAHAYNAGIAAAKGRVLLFSDDDIRFPHNWIEGMCAPIFANEADAVAGGVRIATHLERPWMQEMHRLFIGAETASLADDNFELIGSSMAVARSVLDKVPAFDTELGPGSPTGLWAGEETLFSWQALQAGYRLKLHKEVCVEHHFDPSRLRREAFVARAVYSGRSHAYLAYHWQHKRIRWPLLRLVKAWLRLKSYQVYAKLRPREQDEGIELREFDRVHGVHFYKQYLQECQKPRKYERHGLVKLSP
jgi:glycosyltransferase involved in cell wall biosynthesis